MVFLLHRNYLEYERGYLQLTPGYIILCHLLSGHVNLIPVKLSVETKAEEGSILVEGHDGEVVVHH